YAVEEARVAPTMPGLGLPEPVTTTLTQFSVSPAITRVGVQADVDGRGTPRSLRNGPGGTTRTCTRVLTRPLLRRLRLPISPRPEVVVAGAVGASRTRVLARTR